MSLGGQVTEEDLRRYMIAMGETPMQYQEPYVDQTALAQQAILARPMQQSFTGQPIMSRDVPTAVNEYSGLLYPDIRLPAIAVPQYSQYRSPVNYGGDGGGGISVDSTNPSFTSETGMGVTASGKTFSNPQTIGIQDYANFGTVESNSGTLSDAPGAGNSIGETGMGVNSAGQSVSNDATVAAQDAANFGEDAGSSSDSKIICTAMNHQYGFGSFRNAIWLKYADKHLTKAHEVGYHTLFLPLVKFGFNQGNGQLNMVVRKILEWGTRHRSTDLRAELRNKKRDITGRVIRLIFEPLCYAVGKLKGY